jgi:hypothetical protein
MITGSLARGEWVSKPPEQRRRLHFGLPGSVVLDRLVERILPK